MRGNIGMMYKRRKGMRILFDLTDMYDHVSGMERYSIELAKAVMDNYPENGYTLLFKNYVPETFYDYVMREGVVTTVIRGGSKPVFRQVVLPFYLYRAKADAYCFFAFGEPLLFFNKNIYSMVHDMSPWDNYKDMKLGSNIFFRATIAHTIKYAKGIFTNSKYSAKRILAYAHKKEIYDTVKNKLNVIYAGAGEEFYIEEEPSEDVFTKYNLPKEYLLSLSTIEPRKNIKLLIKAYDKLVKENKDIPKLVLSGRNGWKEDEALGKIPEHIRDRIIFTGFVDDSDLRSLYRNAKAFIFPSKYEGFGLPVLEAMASKTIVITSDATSLPEVTGQDAVIFKSGDADALVNCITKVLNMKDKNKQDIIEHAHLRAKHFRWGKCADKVIKVLKRDGL